MTTLTHSEISALAVGTQIESADPSLFSFIVLSPAACAALRVLPAVTIDIKRDDRTLEYWQLPDPSVEGAHVERRFISGLDLRADDSQRSDAAGYVIETIARDISERAEADEVTLVEAADA